MANWKHVARLTYNIEEWNAWRKKHPNIIPNLGKANLIGADLIGADLSKADLTGADLIGADLSKADLTGTDLSVANLSKADLIGTNLTGADLTIAELIQADLSGATLYGTTLYGTTLTEANFYDTRLGSSIFTWVDLCNIKGLDMVKHRERSIVDINTVKLPQGETRTHFLRGVGFSDTFIDYYDSLFVDAIQYESCFISYAHQDEALAQRLYKDLQDRGVRCWFAPHDLRPGVYYRREITNAIYLHQKVLLLLSEHALQSHWVADEVETVLNREGREHCQLLFPLRLDDAVMLAEESWTRHLRDKRHIGDFTQWHDEEIYQKRFAELLRHLKVKSK